MTPTEAILKKKYQPEQYAQEIENERVDIEKALKSKMPNLPLDQCSERIKKYLYDFLVENKAV